TRVEVRVSIEPQHAQFAALLTAVPRDGTDRADAEAMIATEQDRQLPLLYLAVHALVYQLVPAHHLRQMPVATAGRLPRVTRAAQIPEIDDLELARPQRIDESCHAQRLRSHGSATVGRADIGGSSDQARAHHAQAATCSVGASRCGRIVSSPNRSFGF